MEQIVFNQYRQIEKEVNVTYILMQLRVLKTIAKQSMTKSEWRQKKGDFGYFNPKTFGILKEISRTNKTDNQSLGQDSDCFENFDR